MAEREGFEPSVQGLTPDNCLAGSPVQPLQHLSARVPTGDRDCTRSRGMASKRSESALDTTADIDEDRIAVSC